MQSAPSTPEVTTAEITDSARLIIQCWAAWNQTNQRFDELPHPLRQKYASRATFRSLDIDNPDFWPQLLEWRVLNIPALLMIEHGKLKKLTIGIPTSSKLASLFQAWLETD